MSEGRGRLRGVFPLIGALVVFGGCGIETASPPPGPPVGTAPPASRNGPTADGFPRLSGRAFLVGNEKEALGYGLYSYLLFGSRPAPQSQERYLEAIRAYLDLLEDIGRLEESVPRTQLNVTYLPVNAVASPAPSPEVILAQYNYVRAQILLSKVPGHHLEGPYIVSFREPLSDVTALSREYLYQDLSTVPVSLVRSWVKSFLIQAAKQEYWEPDTGEKVALKVRTEIEKLAEALPQVLESLKMWIVWVR